MAFVLWGPVSRADSIPDNGGLAYVSGGDLILGFTNAVTPAVDGGGNAIDLVVDLGSVTNFYSSNNPLASENKAVAGGLTPGTTYFVSAYNPVDLTNVFGANAFSSTTKWAVLGGNGAQSGPGSAAMFSIWGTATAPLTRGTTASQGIPSYNLAAMVANLANATRLSSRDATTEPMNGAKSFTNLLPATQSVYNVPLYSTTANLATNGLASMDLYAMMPTDSGTKQAFDLGVLSLTRDGLVFLAGIPEPSTDAAILGIGALGFAWLRRTRLRRRRCKAA